LFLFSSRCCLCLQWFSNVFRFFAYVSDSYFKCFICLLLYLITVASTYFKSTSGVAHRIRTGSGRAHRRCSGWRGPIASVLSQEPNALCTCLLPLCDRVHTLAFRTDVRTLPATDSTALVPHKDGNGEFPVGDWHPIPVPAGTKSTPSPSREHHRGEFFPHPRT
jgi:hypothetical protein